MKVLVVGTGALGGYYGGKLAHAGETVHFLARGATLRALRERGLKVVRDTETFELPRVSMSDDPNDGGKPDLVLVTTKSYDLDAASALLKSVVHPETIIIPLQNGVDSAERMRATIGTGRVLRAMTYLSAKVTTPGVIVQAGAERPALLGPLDANDEEAAQAAFEFLQRAQIVVEYPPDVRVAMWTKFMMAVSGMGVQSLTGLASGPTREDPDIRALYEASMCEVESLARHSGVPLPDDVVAQTMATIDSYPPQVKASMLVDLEQGRRLELDAIHGTVVRLGRTLGVPVPVNHCIYAALKLRAHPRT